MKKLLLTIACILGTLGAYAQGYELSIEGMGSVGPIRCSNNYAGINILNGYRFNWGNGFYAGVGSGIVGTAYLTDFKRVDFADGTSDFSKQRERGNFFDVRSEERFFDAFGFGDGETEHKHSDSLRGEGLG